jgi:hypothetical protein
MNKMRKRVRFKRGDEGLIINAGKNNFLLPNETSRTGHTRCPTEIFCTNPRAMKEFEWHGETGMLLHQEHLQSLVKGLRKIR